MATTVLLAAWLVFAIVVIGHPDLAGHPESADAVVVLGPSNKRIEQARALAAEVGTTNLVLSIGDFPAQAGTCTQPNLQVTCFVPEPYSTRGEAAEIGALARENGWHSIIVISAQAQASRARWLIERCFPGDLQMVAATNPESVTRGLDWVGQAFYETGAWVKATVSASCTTAPRADAGRNP